MISYSSLSVCLLLSGISATSSLGTGHREGRDTQRAPNFVPPALLFAGTTSESGTEQLRLRVEEAIGTSQVQVWAQVRYINHFDWTQAVPIGVINPDSLGNGSTDTPMPEGTYTDRIGFIGTYVSNGQLQSTNVSVIGGSPGTCELIDFDWFLGATPSVAGTFVDTQYAGVGLNITTDNFDAAHPDQAIIFDSSNPTGEDPDLVTPGYGPGNDTGYGKLLIIAEDVVDTEPDGLVDDPDDERLGGTIFFNFDEPAVLCSITLVDIDDLDRGPSFVRTFNGVTPVDDIQAPDLGDNALQTILFSSSPVTELRVEFGGSGGIAQLELIPCPRDINFDTTTFGIPLGLPAGTIMTNQYNSSGFDIGAQNNHPAHPDIALLFDTANPTGGDTDLITPGYGPGNITAEDLCLIIGENDVDADNDNLVDDPDDEALGGRLVFEFFCDVTLDSARVLDVESPGAEFRAFDASTAQIGTFPVAAAGDNSLQTIDFGGLGGVRRLLLIVPDSGAVTDLRFCPCQNGE